MGFLEEASRQNTVAVEITNKHKMVRPLATKPITVWCHKIHKHPENAGPGEKVLRRFYYMVCTSNGYGGNGCVLCNTPDPLWTSLSKRQQVNSRGTRTDFPKSPIHMLPVFDYEASQVKILKGGNQLYEQMNLWYGSQNDSSKDLRRCDWEVWKDGEKQQTKYHSQRMDETLFQSSPEMIEKAKQALLAAQDELRQMNPEDLSKVIKGQWEEDSFDFGANLLPPPPFEQLGPPSAAFSKLLTGMAEKSIANPPPALTVTSSLPPVGGLSSVVLTTPTIVEPLVAPSLPQITTAQAAQMTFDKFATWISAQPELQGMGILEILVPSMREAVGTIDYHKCTPEQLLTAKAALEITLAKMRAK